MIDTLFVTSHMKNPILVIRFAQDHDIGMAFCADLDDNKKLKGLSLFYIRTSENIVHRTKPQVIETIFHPKLSMGKKPNTYQLQITPLDEKINITQNEDKFTCQIPFKTEGKIGKLLHIDVDAQRSPLTIHFEINASYRHKKDSPYQYLKNSIKAPDDFTKEAYNLLMAY